LSLRESEEKTISAKRKLLTKQLEVDTITKLSKDSKENLVF